MNALGYDSCLAGLQFFSVADLASYREYYYEYMLMYTCE